MGRRGWAAVLAVGTGMWVFLTSGGWQVGGDMDLLAWGGDLMARWGVHVYVHQPKLLVGPLPLLYAKAAPLWLELVTPAVVAGVTVWLVARRDLWWAVILLPVLIAAPATGGVEDAVTAWCALGVVVWLRRRPWLAGLLLGVGVGCKPWILPLVVLAVALPRRRAVEYLAAAGGVVAVVWGPFLLGDLGTLHALGSYWLPPEPGSVWSALHLDPPPGLRLVELAAMCAALVLLRRNLAAAVLAAFTVRVGLEPGSWAYYATPLAVLAPRVSPRWTVPAVLAVWLSGQMNHPRAGALPSPDWWGWLRLVGLVVIVAVCAWPEVRAWRGRERSREAVPVAG